MRSLGGRAALWLGHCLAPGAYRERSMAEPSPQASGDGRKSEQDWVKELADKESEYGTQLGAMTQKNAQMRVELKKCAATSKKEIWT